MKLLAGLYAPTRGTVRYQGRDLREWDPVALRQRVGVIFQDFNRYQLTVGENIGAGDVAAFEDRGRWSEAAAKGQAADFIGALPAAYDTQLGRWFNNGQELSGGQWQRIALARAFMRTGAEILVLDEPTAAMDAEAEAEIFEHFRALTSGPHRGPDLAPLLDGPLRRPDRGARRRPRRGARQSRGAHGAGGPLRPPLQSAGARLSLIGAAPARGRRAPPIYGVSSTVTRRSAASFRPSAVPGSSCQSIS